MLRPDLQKRSLSPSRLLELSIQAPHPRTRERLLALFLLAQPPPQSTCAAHLCHKLGRDVHTLLKWVHDFNAGGLPALVYRHSGGTPLAHAGL